MSDQEETFAQASGLPSGGEVFDALAGDHVPADVTPGPAPVIAGTFAIYEDGRGGYVLVTDTEAHGISRQHIPGALIKLAGGGLLGVGGGALGRRLLGKLGGS